MRRRTVEIRDFSPPAPERPQVAGMTVVARLLLCAASRAYRLRHQMPSIATATGAQRPQRHWHALRPHAPGMATACDARHGGLRNVLSITLRRGDTCLCWTCLYRVQQTKRE